ncbi:MAG: DNRLRE domain-containing protein [Clostridia bacterium]|nr:DNRLRE domain-containing protein [Clostridia bacterium]
MSNQKHPILTKLMVFTLILSLNLGAIDSFLQGLTSGVFKGMVNRVSAEELAKTLKPTNKLPDTAGPKVEKDPLAEEAKARNEVISKRTLNSKTFELGEDKYLTEISLNPIHYQEKGKLIDIDNTLVPARVAGYAYENKANSFKVFFTPKTGDKKFVRTQQGKHQLEWQILDVQAVQGTVIQNAIIYPEIKDKVDLRYTVADNQVKEDIILKDQGAPSDFKFNLLAGNLQVNPKNDGTIDLVEPGAQTPVWSFAKPYMYDAAGARSEAVTMNVEKQKGGHILTLSVDKKWLADPARKWPVIVDPILQPGPVDGRDTYISSLSPNSNYRSTHTLQVGYGSQRGETRSFFVFKNLFAQVPKGVKITSASFSVFPEQDIQGDTTIDLYPVLVNWSWENSTLTWNWWAKNGRIGSLIASKTGSNGSWWSYDVKDLVQKWVDGSIRNNGMMLAPRNKNQAARIFYSCDDPKKDYRPILKVEYTKKPEPKPEPKPDPKPADFQLHINRKTGKIKADGTAVKNARIYLSGEGNKWTTSADSSGKWAKDGMDFTFGKTHEISMYYEYDVTSTDSKGNKTTKTYKVGPTS